MSPNTNASTGWFVDGNRNVNPSANRTPLITQNIFRGHAAGANTGTRALLSATVSNNDFDMNSADGLQGGPKDSFITGNRFTGNGRSGLALTSFALTAAVDLGAIAYAVTREVVRCPDGWTNFTEKFVIAVFLVVPPAVFAALAAVNLVMAEPEHRRRGVALIVGAIGGGAVVLALVWWLIQNAPSDPCFD